MDKRSQSPNPNDEKIILQEDCSEDNLKNGILTLTNKQLVFEKTKGRIVTLSKKLLTERLEIKFNEISNFKSEGIIIKKLVIILKNDTIYKFGVLNPKNWIKDIQIQINKYGKDSGL
jgi:hypothetical protein